MRYRGKLTLEQSRERLQETRGDADVSLRSEAETTWRLRLWEGFLPGR